MPRYQRYAPDPRLHHEAYEQGKSQGALNVERYHILRACLLKKYAVVEETPDYKLCQLFPVQGLDFSEYKDYKLKNTGGMKLRPNSDGTIPKDVLEECHHCLEESWKCSEGGILYVIGEGKNFYCPMHNYNSHDGTTGNADWDRLFDELKAKDIPKSMIPCMFFARESGCLDAKCPFLHDEKHFRELREKLVLSKRRQEMSKPTSRQMAYQGKNLKEGDTALAFCANPSCLKVWLEKDEECPLKACSNCKWTYYCSVSCQKKDWKRHKKEPCAPIDQMVENDDLWSPIGTRKGTEWMNINWGGA
ncbi:hypothetical protein SCHPADRAFT_850479 [Schizopora paradoxa]|uniref:MYND-type domain-containing protein n=1 Tax=Schizopora paradoxa TaxID=27342 RepID=A0A0H2RSH4_9AGAM|nr:hypothetical protein SCHPADRAFT_850479 [Schizopora paradoxa]